MGMKFQMAEKNIDLRQSNDIAIGIGKELVNTVTSLASLVSNTLTGGLIDPQIPQLEASNPTQSIAMSTTMVATIFIAPEGEIGKLAEGVQAAEKVGGRLGSAETRALDKTVAKGLEDEGYKVTHGAGKPQEYIPSAEGGRKGSAYPDVTAVKGDKTVRVNTVDTKKGGALTGREAKNADKIKTLQPKDELRTVPKKKTDGT